MKTGRSITELAAEIERQAKTKRDMIAEPAAITMQASPAGIELQIGTGAKRAAFGVNRVAHGQLATIARIPRDYYDRMEAEAPELLAVNVNRWVQAAPEKRMIRTLDGRVRAVLSDKYAPLENLDLAEAVLPILADQRLEIVSCEVTEQRLYLKAVDQRIQRDIPVGHRMGDGSHVIFDTCVPAIVVRNSEVGLGALSIETGMLTRACTNLAFFDQTGMKRRHVGARHDLVGDDMRELLTDETRRATDRAVWMQARDVVRAAFDPKVFDQRIEKVAATTARKIEGGVQECVEFARRRFGLTENEGKSVLRHLIEGGSLTQYGLFNAITRTAEDTESYDRASELERTGGQVIDLAPHEWKRISLAEGDPAKLLAAA